MGISWMDPERLSLLGELSQKKKYHINTHVWNLKNSTRYYLQNRNRDTDISNKYIGTKEGWG